MKPQHPGLVAIVVLVLAACATTTVTSPTGRRQVVGGVTDAQLNQLGAQAFAETKAKEKVIVGGAQNAYVGCVVNALVAQLDPQWRSTPWETALFQDDEANAFALPGGKVGVNTGIFKAAKNQDQLAAVLGHEIGHVISHHHAERLTHQQNSQTGVTIASVLAGVAFGQGAMDVVNSAGSFSAQSLILLPNSRVQESEADVVGQRLMAQAGFDPSQAVALWKNMLALGGDRPPQWLSTHPDPDNRIKELQKDAPALMPVYRQARANGRIPHCG